MHIVITGATKGIGLAIAQSFARQGAQLAICSRHESDLAQAKATLEDLHPDCQVLTMVADVRSKEAVQAFGAYVLERMETVDVLVNNAGVFIPGQVHLEDEGVMEKMMETNLYSAYHLTRKLLPAMLAQQRGHVFNICSIASLFAYPNGGSYSISKYAMLGFSKALREEMKDKGIRVTSVMPGATWSASWAGVDLPYERLMPPEDVASVIWNCWKMSPSTVVEDIVLRPQLGDL